VTGPAGPAGATGATGPAGATGATGATGVQNIFGSSTGSATEGDNAQCVIGDVWLTAGSTSGATPASGQTLLIQSNEVLFSLLGTMYGGDGTRTFQLPNLQSAAPNGLTYVICTHGTYPT